MDRPRITRGIAVLVFAAGAAVGQVWHASSGFSDTQNPNGDWSYGWTQTLGSSFNLMTGTTSFCGAPSWIATTVPGVCVVEKNTLPAPLTCGNGTYPPLGLILHPGPGNERAVVRWTAPAAGSCSVSATFPGVNFTPTTDVAVLHNATVLGSAEVTTFAEGPSFFFTVAVQAGDTVDLLVGYGTNGNYFNDATGLLASITLNVASVGPGCGASPPVLHATPLPLGGSGTISIANAALSTVGALFASAPVASAAYAGGGCFVYLNLAGFIELASFAVGPAGTWSLAVTLPADPLLGGIQAALQAVILPTSGALGFDLSNGIVVTLGS